MAMKRRVQNRLHLGRPSFTPFEGTLTARDDKVELGGTRMKEFNESVIRLWVRAPVHISLARL
jgi:hypothetical protein